jgi:hypothetical protein
MKPINILHLFLIIYFSFLGNNIWGPMCGGGLQKRAQWHNDFKNNFNLLDSILLIFIGCQICDWHFWILWKKLKYMWVE